MFTEVFLHLFVNIREVTEGERPAVVARKKLFLILPLLSPPSDLATCSVQMSHHLPDIHGWSKGQHSSHWQVNILVSRQSFEFLYEFQPCALGVLMMACSSKDVKHLGNNARQMPIVVCKLLSSVKDLDLICHMVVLHSECRCSSFCKSLEGFFKPLLKHCHYWVCVSGSYLPISHFLRECPHITTLLLSVGMFHDVLIDNCIDQEVSTDCLVVVGSPLIVQNLAWCYPLIQDKTSWWNPPNQDADVLIVQTTIASAQSKDTNLVGDDTDLLTLLLHHADTFKWHFPFSWEYKSVQSIQN